jgi:hypothetical protein
MFWSHSPLSDYTAQAVHYTLDEVVKWEKQTYYVHTSAKRNLHKTLDTPKKYDVEHSR